MSTKKMLCIFFFLKEKATDSKRKSIFDNLKNLWLYFEREPSKNQQNDFLKALKIYADYHVTSILSQIFFSSPSVEKYFAFSIFGTTLIVSPRRNSAFAVVFAIID